MQQPLLYQYQATIFSQHEVLAVFMAIRKTSFKKNIRFIRWKISVLFMVLLENVFNSQNNGRPCVILHYELKLSRNWPV